MIKAANKKQYTSLTALVNYFADTEREILSKYSGLLQKLFIQFLRFLLPKEANINHENLESILKTEESKELASDEHIIDQVIEFFKDKVSIKPHKNLRENLLSVLKDEKEGLN